MSFRPNENKIEGRENKMDSNELERLHDSGKIPDKFYF